MKKLTQVRTAHQG